eukprot:scaffold27603_cov73-Skeletonema_marinoi.AAC.1
MNTAANPIETLFHRKLKKQNDRSLHSLPESDQSVQVTVAGDSTACDNSIFDDLGHAFMEAPNNGVYGLGDWFAKYKVPLKQFDIVEKKKRTVIVAFLFRGLHFRREFIFDTEQDAARFCQVIEREKQLLGCRAKARLEATLGDIKLKEGEQLSLLVDIISGTDLPTKGPNPYVV